MKYQALVDGYSIEIRRGESVIARGRWTGHRIEAAPPVLPGTSGEDETRAIYRQLEQEAVDAERRALAQAPAAEDDSGVDLTLIAWAERLTPEERLRMVGGTGYDVTALLGILVARRVDFIVVGGAAAVLQGAPIVTADVDILYSQDPTNIARLLAALEELDAVFRDDLSARRIRPNDTHLSAIGKTQRLQTRHGPLDLLSIAAWPSRSGSPDPATADLDYAAWLPDAMRMEVGGLEVRVAPLERIIQAKRIAARPKDLLALVELEAALALRGRPRE